MSASRVKIMHPQSIKKLEPVRLCRAFEGLTAKLGTGVASFVRSKLRSDWMQAGSGHTFMLGNCQTIAFICFSIVS